VSSDDSAEEIYDELEVIGTDRLIAPVPGAVKGFSHDALSTRDGVNRIAEALSNAAEKAKSRGIKIGYHNHDFEWQPVEDGTPAYDLLARNLSEDVFLELDIYWAATAGQKPAEVAAQYANRIHLLHVKDGPAKRGELQTTIGQGSVDNVGAIAAASAVEWHVVELDESAGDPFDDSATGGQWLVDNGHSTWA
jgi:sugar phosphate isomerase/epimerase